MNTIRFLFLCSWVSVISISAQTQQAVSSVEAIPMLSGALLADGFDGPELDTRTWHRPNWRKNDPDLSVGVEYGHLQISGISRPPGKHH